MLEVHLDPATINSRKVLAGLELLGVPYKVNHVNYFAGAHKQPPYTDLNPNGVLPAAKDGDFTLWESDAILQYAADMSGADKYYPKDMKKRVDVNRWLLWEAAHWQPSCYVFFIENAIKPLMKAPTDKAADRKRDAELAAAGRRARREAGKIEMARGRHRDHRRHRGRGADARAPEADACRSTTYPNIRRWIAEVEKLPCWQKTQGPVDAATSPH